MVVDTTNRLQLRELNEVNFARFDARLEQRVSKLEHQIARFDERVGATLRRMFLFWATTTAALVGIALRQVSTSLTQKRPRIAPGPLCFPVSRGGQAPHPDGGRRGFASNATHELAVPPEFLWRTQKYSL